MARVLFVCALAVLLPCAVTSAKSDGSFCNGIKSCQCTVSNGTISFCTRNVQRMYLHDIQDEPILYISPNAFNYLTKVEELHLTSNKIWFLEKNTFSGLPKLSYLFLGDNNITVLHPGAFNGLTKLQYLSLAGNPNAQCPSFIPLCAEDASHTTPCCTMSIPNPEVVKMVEEMQAKEAERREKEKAEAEAKKAEAKKKKSDEKKAKEEATGADDAKKDDAPSSEDEKSSEDATAKADEKDTNKEGSSAEEQKQD